VKFPVTIIDTGNICACSKIDVLTSGLEEVDKVVVAMVQAGSCPTTSVTCVAGETLLIMFLVFAGVRRISVT
jgi:hypothetical protein